MESEAVLVTGGAGYIGSHVCKALAREGFLPIVLDNLSMGHNWAVKWGPLCVGNISDAAALKEAVANRRIVGIIHLAAKAYVGESVHKPELYFDNNVRQLLDFLENTASLGVGAFVFSSSCSIYGTPRVLPVTEDVPIDPLSPYAQTKVFGEWAIRAFAVKTGMRYAFLRYFNAAGADPEGEIGECHDPETHLLPNAIQAALGGPPLKIFGTDYETRDGTCVRDYIHVTDLANAHIQALKRCLSGQNTVANLGIGTGYTVLEAIKAVESVTGKRVAVEYSARREGDAEALFAANDRARELLNWTPSFNSLEPIIETAFRWTSRKS